ncbi:MAG: hypothetical protein M5U19_21330 [Microthrixaceae bacterium]|nr:hypothetical protein [Microthrixaceae bacterium]
MGVEAAMKDGDWTSSDGANGVRVSDVQYGDLTGDGGEEAVVSFECYAVGGNAYPIVVSLVFTSEGDEPVLLGAAITGASPTIDGDSLRTSDPVWTPDDPRCCPSGTDEKSWRYHDGTWVPS